MRKYIKSMRDQSENNSTIFKQAKKMFHYEPNEKLQKFSIHGKRKEKSFNNKFKEDFSSVQEMKNQNNQINESSWIAKLVNVMHENSEESSKPISNLQQNQEITINICPEPLKEKQTNLVSSKEISLAKNSISGHSTKKNSIVINKRNDYNLRNHKNSTGKKEESCDTVSQKYEKSGINTIKRTKNSFSTNKPQVNIPRSKSSINIKKNMGYKKKSLQNIFQNKGNQTKSNQVEKRFREPLSHQLPIRLKHDVTNLHKMSQSLHQMQEIAFHSGQQKQSSYGEIKQKINQILDDQKNKSLFHDEPVIIHQYKEQYRSSERTNKVGSIKKNRVVKQQPNKQEIEEKIILRPKIDISLSFSNKNIHQVGRGIISERKMQQDDVVTARQQKDLIEKYIKSDFSFKSHKIHSNEPAKALKKQIGKRFSYLGNNGDKIQNNQIDPIVPTIRETAHFTKEFDSFNDYRNIDHRKQEPLFKQEIKYTTTNQQNLFRLQQKYNYVPNKDTNISDKITKKNSINPTIYEAKINKDQLTLRDPKYNFINRNAYLQQSAEIEGSNKHLTNVDSNLSTPYYKAILDTKLHQKSIVPSKYSYLTLNSACQQTKRVNTEDYQTDRMSHAIIEPQSDVVIERLNSKLNSYINNNNLNKEAQQPKQWTQNQPTHRMMHLNFNELKKHSQFYQR